LIGLPRAARLRTEGAEAKSLQLWSDRFFLATLEKMVAA
jgi:hypothetical protein